MDFKDLSLKARSCRRFDESRPVPRQVLVDLVDLARRSPSGSNRQPLKYLIVDKPAERRAVFETLSWAGLLKEWKGPAEGERPTGYIVILRDDSVSKDSGVDHGIAAWTMQLAASERGLGACMIGSVKRDALRAAFSIPAGLEILLVLSLGVPAETIVLEDAAAGATAYYRDAQDHHHVPKRPLAEVLLSGL